MDGQLSTVHTLSSFPLLFLTQLITRRVHAGYMASLLERQAAQDRMQEASEDEQEMEEMEEKEEMEEMEEIKE